MKIMDMMMKMEEGVFLKIQNWISRLFLIHIFHSENQEKKIRSKLEKQD